MFSDVETACAPQINLEVTVPLTQKLFALFNMVSHFGILPCLSRSNISLQIQSNYKSNINIENIIKYWTI
jgi:hypothetical protein